jgi:hypothetical protein
MFPTAFRCCLPLLLLAVEFSAAAEPDSRIRLVVPAYFYPAGEGLKDWNRLLATGKKVPVLAIVNPNSGPGEKADPVYTKVLDRAKKAPGVTLLGYVSTRYGKRLEADVRADIQRWSRLYPQVGGVFLDEQASAADSIDYYTALYKYAHERKFGPVVSNPGTVCAEVYLSRPASDAACLFEAGKGFADFRQPEWTSRYRASRFAALAYDVQDAERMRDYLAVAREQRIGLVYITDGAGANPWGRLPAYWDEEVAATAKLKPRERR